jgi:hypothetical protein
VLAEQGIGRDVASMVSVDRAVVRMFSCEPNTVRWETRIADGRGLELKVYGPGTVRQEHAFADAVTLVGYQVQIEQQLLSNGYAVLPLSERRSGYDRRLQPRTSQDRRRQ